MNKFEELQSLLMVPEELEQQQQSSDPRWLPDFSLKFGKSLDDIRHSDVTHTDVQITDFVKI